MTPVTPKAKRVAKPATPQSAQVSPTTGLVTRARAKFILQQGDTPFAPEPVLSRRTSQRRTSRNNAPVTPPSSPSLTPPYNAARDFDMVDVQPQPFPQQRNARPRSPPEFGDPFAPVRYTSPNTPFVLTQEEVDQINRLPHLRFGDARAPSAAPSDIYRAPTPGYPAGWNTKDLASNYDSSQVLRDQLDAMTPEERASHHEARQFICLSRGTTPALSTWYAPTPQGAPLPLLPSPVIEAEEPPREPTSEPVRPPTPEPEPLRRARVPSTLGPVRENRRTSLRSYASHSALSMAARAPTTSPSRPRRTSAKYGPQ